MTKIRSGNSLNEMSVNAAKSAHVTLYDEEGNEIKGLMVINRTTGNKQHVHGTNDGSVYSRLSNIFSSQSGSIFTEGIRDDISLTFSRSKGVASIATLIDNGSVNGTVTHDSTNGQAVFAVPATAGSTCYFSSTTPTIYEPGHMIRGGMTIEISALPLGNGKIEWGYGEDDGAGDVLNGIGWGIDVDGLYTFRKKASVYVSKVYQSNFNRDKMNGVDHSFYLLDGVAVKHNPLKNCIYEVGYEWFGVASPTFYVLTPEGVPLVVNVEETATQINGTTLPDPEIPLFIRVKNDSVSGQAINVKSGSWRGGIITNKSILVGRDNDASVYHDVAVNDRGELITSNRPQDGSKATYSASIIGLAPATSPTDLFTVTGSAIKTVRILQILATATRTAGGNADYVILKRSTANSGGTSSTLTAVPHDSSDSAATAVVRAYTANPTTGTLVGNISTQKIFTNTAGSGASDKFEEIYGIRPSKGIVLRGVNEVFAFNLNGVTMTGGSFDIHVEWTEE